MSKFEIVLSIILLPISFIAVIVTLIWYARKNGITFAAACKVLWREGVVSAYKEFADWLCKTVKALPVTLKKLVDRYYVPFCIWLESKRRLRRPRIQWGYDCECEFRSVLTDYAYKKFEPYINVHSGVPSVIQIQYITQKSATDDEVQECLECLVMKFRHYCTAYNLTVQFFPYFIRNGCEVNIFILYCEYEQELPDFYKTVHTVIMTKTSGSFGTLKECNIPKRNSDELILGYNGTKWTEGGIVSPYVWQYIKDPSLLYGGVTGAGKSVAAQLLVKQLLEQKKDVYICDFKAGKDWDGIFKSDRYAEYKDCGRLFDEFYNSFVNSLETKVYNESFIVFDEITSFVMSLDSKERKDFMNKLSHIAFMGRSANKHLILISQQFNAEVLPTAIREQVGTRIYCGNRIYQESRHMLYGSTEMPADYLPNFNGFISSPQVEIGIITFPELSNPQQLKRELQALGQQYYT